MFVLCSTTKYWTLAIVFVYLYENKNMVLTFAQRIATEIQSEMKKRPVSFLTVVDA